jgi:O-glycosyl hydrolase
MLKEDRVSARSEARKQWAALAIPILVSVIWTTGTSASAQQAQVVLDGHSKGRVFDGLGAASAGASSRLLIDYPEPQRSQILDYLFKPGYGAALQHLKVEIGADVNSTDGSEPSHMRSASDHDSTRGYEWWLMVEANKRNPNIVLEILPWGAPGWVGKDTLYTAKMTEYVADFIRTAKSDYSLDITYAGAWNEKVFDIPYINELHRRLTADHLSTKVICCDEYPGEGAGQWSVADEMLKDPELAAAVQVIGVHYPLVDGKIATTNAAQISRMAEAVLSSVAIGSMVGACSHIFTTRIILKVR